MVLPRLFNDLGEPGARFVRIGTPCIAAGCTSDYYLGHSAVTADATGKLTVLYDGATSSGGPQQVLARRSIDGGVTWSPRTTLSAAE